MKYHCVYFALVSTITGWYKILYKLKFTVVHQPILLVIHGTMSHLSYFAVCVWILVTAYPYLGKGKARSQRMYRL